MRPLREPPEQWEGYADAVLQREAAVSRIGLGLLPRDFAGMYVDHEDVDRILRTLPGLDGPDQGSVAEVYDDLEPIVSAARREFHDALSDDGQFSSVVRSACLSIDEAEVLALATAVEIDPARQRLVSYLQDSIQLPRLTMPTLRRMFPPPHTGPLALSSEGRLDRCGLVEWVDDAAWAVRMVQVPRRMLWALSGDEAPDPELPLDHEWRAGSAFARDVDLLLVPGGDRTSRIETVLRHLGGSRFLVVPDLADDAQWRAAVREATVTSSSLILDLPGRLTALDRYWIQRADHLPVAICSPTELSLESLPGRPWVEVVADEIAASSDARVAGVGGHRLDAEQIRLANLAYRGDADAAVRRLASGHLDGLALHLRPSRGWSDIVLPDDQRTQLDELVARYRTRRTVFDDWAFDASPSAGIVAVFSGPSGTGKTLAAEVIAGELGLDLYKIDLSAVVSKYIGETEKNLERIFAAAAMGNVVLFFDEADALFGKRSDVGDAHDRYANIEVSYLLQRLERHDGLVVMATNLQRNMDSAFLRRIHVSVAFPMPDEEARRSIWRLSLSADAPVTDDVDFDFLARQFDVPGGAIRNAALTAAFLAADSGEPIAMDHVIRGLRREFQKLGRLQTATEFDRYHDVIADVPVAAS